MRSLPALLALTLTACATTSSITPDATPSAPAAPAAASPKAAGDLDARARALHASSIVIDTHDDVTSPILDEGFDLAHPNGKTATDLPRMRAGGITAEFFAIFVDRQFADAPNPRKGGGSARRALDMIDVVYQQIERHPQDLVLATKAERHPSREGRREDRDPHGHRRGPRDRGLARRAPRFPSARRPLHDAHAHEHERLGRLVAASRCPSPRRTTGSRRSARRSCARCSASACSSTSSHVSDGTFWSVMKVAKAPVIASHSSSRALADHRAQHDRRHASRAREERRRRDGELLAGVHRIGNA